jgi:hypothetical protein
VLAKRLRESEPQPPSLRWPRRADRAPSLDKSHDGEETGESARDGPDVTPGCPEERADRDQPGVVGHNRSHPADGARWPLVEHRLGSVGRRA